DRAEAHLESLGPERSTRRFRRLDRELEKLRKEGAPKGAATAPTAATPGTGADPGAPDPAGPRAGLSEKDTSRVETGTTRAPGEADPTPPPAVPGSTADPTSVDLEPVQRLVG